MKLRRFLQIYSFAIVITFMLSTDLSALDNSDVNVHKKLSELSREDFIKMASPKKVDRYIQKQIMESYAQSPYYNPGSAKNTSPKLQTQNLPDGIRTPGEFEESQAVLITWPEYAYDSSGYGLEAFTEGVGYYYDQFGIHWENIAGYQVDLYQDSPYPEIWKEMVKAIQPEAQVWIRVVQPKDTSDIKSWLTFKGVSLYNYRFFIDTVGQNAFWSRDFGPYGVYYGANDDLMFINAMYYPFRPIDNDFPDRLATKLGYDIYDSKLETEGGNFITDGNGNIFFSSVIYENNMDSVGKALEYKAPMSQAEVNNEITSIFGAKKLNMLPMLYCDGGTGHVDMYLKMTDDRNFIVMDYPSKYNTSKFPDFATANNNYQTIQSLTNIAGDHYTIDTLPFPTKDNGTLPDAICDSVFQDARTYVNGLTVNNTYIVPVYSNPATGLRQQDQDAIELLKKYMPGYTIYPIDARALTVGGGAIHCVTMQIPAENPVVIEHRPVVGLQNKDADLNFAVNVKNHSGIDTVMIFVKKNGASQWDSYPMATADNTEFTYSFPSGTFQQSDEAEYYIAGKTNNGKEFRKPGKSSYYDFYFQPATDVNENININKAEIASIIPNPVSENAMLRIVSGVEISGDVEVFDAMGTLVLKGSQISLKQGINDISLNMSNLPAGAYHVVLKVNGTVSTKELMVIR